jgi:hypothetical protein
MNAQTEVEVNGVVVSVIPAEVRQRRLPSAEHPRLLPGPQPEEETPQPPKKKGRKKRKES